METRFGLEASCRGHGFWEYARTMIEPQFVVFINRGLAGPWESFFFYASMSHSRQHFLL